MGASSVTGKGDGSVDRHGGGKGPGNLRNNFVPLQGPNIVACGVASIVPTEQGEYFIRTPYQLALPEENYAAFAMPLGTSQPEMSIGGFYSDGNNGGSIIHLSTVDVGEVYWMIVKKGFGMEAESPV
ncbi:MAG: hypothetical protein M0R80_08385 [Proteobacteria bacterium]|jgi:hypothetical protein|nr:hypothetical protein [Pseudomonadota bacterium]